MADATFALSVVSPQGTVFQGRAVAVTVPGADGELSVLAGHMPLVAGLADGEVRVKTAERETSIAITGGFLRVRRDGVTILSDFAAEAESIEVARVEEARERARRLLAEAKERRDVVLLERDFHRAILQLKVAEKIRRRRASRT
jgi:F-type H+-transporting ATPase subunit epsilon